MSGFVATPPAPHSPAGAVVEADGWFPAIDVNAVRDAIRLRGEVPHVRLVAAIEGAVLTVTGELAEWQAAHVANGIESLAEVDDRQIAGRNRLEMLFERAVRFAAAAELSDLARDMTATDAAIQRIDEESPPAMEMHRLSTLAIRDILGVTRCVSELI